MIATRKRLTCGDYHVAWICPVADIELLPACLMLDEEHDAPKYDTHYDENTYIFGSIQGHTVVIGSLPKGLTGNIHSARLTGPMFKSFPNIRMALLVGTGGGIPTPESSEDTLENLHLGDVVVGYPGDGKPSCVHYSRGRAKDGGEFELVGTLRNPDWRLTNALAFLDLEHRLGQTTFDKQVARLRAYKGGQEFHPPSLEHDRLFRAASRHRGVHSSDCNSCNQHELVQRPSRTEKDRRKMVFHFGRIATGDAVIQNGELRDGIRTRCDGALCVEMEAAGVDVNRQCLVIRGISNYADGHKNDMWRSHAAGNAAAFTRELLCRVPSAAVFD